MVVGSVTEEKLTHLDARGRAQMVDVTAKADTVREAVARIEVRMQPQTLALIQEGGLPKGDVLGVAQVAGIMAAKRTSELIPMCHPLFISSIKVNYWFDEAESAVHLEARAKTTGKTGVEMEALTAASVSALTIYDMCKAVDREMVITNLRLVEKSGGKSGNYKRGGEEVWDAL
jgi:cyclic pyranopterin phosphate synthase